MDQSEVIEELLSKLSRTANYFRGMCLDPRMPSEIKVSVIAKVTEMDDFCERIMNTINPQ